MRKVEIDGVTLWEIHGSLYSDAFVQKLLERNRPVAGDSLCGWKPLVSDALAVHPDQVPEATESARRHDVPVEFQPDGRPILSSRSRRKAYLKAYGFRDNQGGYGD